MSPTIAFRITEQDRRLVEAAAKQARRTLSDWVRLTLVDAACDILPRDDVQKLVDSNASVTPLHVVGNADVTGDCA